MYGWSRKKTHIYTEIQENPHYYTLAQIYAAPTACILLISKTIDAIYLMVTDMQTWSWAHSESGHKITDGCDLVLGESVGEISDELNFTRIQCNHI